MGDKEHLFCPQEMKEQNSTSREHCIYMQVVKSTLVEMLIILCQCLCKWNTGDKL